MRLRIEVERENDGRWIAAVPELPGGQVYGATRDDELTHVQALALSVIADEIEAGERDGRSLLAVSFATDAAA